MRIKNCETIYSEGKMDEKYIYIRIKKRRYNNISRFTEKTSLLVIWNIGYYAWRTVGQIYFTVKSYHAKINWNKVAAGY